LSSNWLVAALKYLAGIVARFTTLTIALLKLLFD
jgi:hypothetical protein